MVLKGNSPESLIQLEDTRCRFLSLTFALVSQACPLVGVQGPRQSALELRVRRALWIWQNSVFGERHLQLGSYGNH